MPGHRAPTARDNLSRETAIAKITCSTSSQRALQKRCEITRLGDREGNEVLCKWTPRAGSGESSVATSSLFGFWAKACGSTCPLSPQKKG